MKPLYVLERYEHGWAIKVAAGESGVPIDALKECSLMCPEGAVIDAGIANFLDAVMVVGVPDGLELWRKEIQKHLDASHHPKEIKWILGLDTGTSSLTIFAALCGQGYRGMIYRRTFNDDRADTPHDAADFARCYRLLQLFPEWEARLSDVGEKYPQTKWKQVAESWQVLKSRYEEGDKDGVTRLLREISK